MTTLTEDITGKLLDAVDDPSKIQAVLHEHANSKGPLYIALAQATATLRDQFSSLSEQFVQAKKLHQDLQQQTKSTEQKLNGLQAETTQKTKELAALNEKLQQNNASLDHAKIVKGLGFGLDQLTRLHDILDALAVSHGHKPKEAVAAFFEKVASYGDLVSLEDEAESAAVAAGKAKAETEKWQAEAKAAEVKCKVRKTSIDLTEKMLAQGVKASDLPEWADILSKAGVSPDHLAKALTQFASVDELRQNLQEQSKGLEKQISELNAQMAALTAERGNMNAAVAALRDKALTEIEEVSSKIQEHLAVLMTKAADYVDLEHKAATLSQEVVLARAVREGDPATWGNVTLQAVRELMNAIILWCRADVNHNPVLPSPPGSLASKVYVMYTLDKVRLDDVLLWALSGLFTEEERTALGVE